MRKHYKKSHRVKKKVTARQKIGRIMRKPRVWIGIFSLALAGLLFYGAVWSEFSQVKAVGVEGTRTLEQDTLRSAVWSQIPFRFPGASSTSIVLVGSSAIEQSLLSEFPVLEQVEVRRDFRTQTVNLMVQERIPAAQWCFEESCFAVDRTGIVFREISSEDLPSLLLEGASGQALGSALVDPASMELFMKIKEALDSFEGAEAVLAQVQGTQVQVRTKEGWTVRLDAAESSQWQQEKLRAVLKEAVTPASRAQLEYIDLRFGDQAYVKYRD